MIDKLSNELYQEIRKTQGKKYPKEPEAIGYNDPMYDKIKAYTEREQSPATTLFDRDPEDKAPLDNLLQSLAKFAEYYKVELPITLFIKGTVVSGMLVGHTEFYEQFEKQIQGLTSSTTEGAKRIKQLSDALQKAHESTISKFEKLSSEAKDAALSGARYLHLKSTQIVSSNGPNIPLGPRGLLKIRTNSIDAFSIGAIRSFRGRSVETGQSQQEADKGVS